MTARRVHHTQACKLRPHDVLRRLAARCEEHARNAAAAERDGLGVAQVLDRRLAEHYSRQAFALVEQFKRNAAAAQGRAHG